MTAQPVPPASLNPDHTRRQYDLLFAPHVDALPEDAVITVSHPLPGRPGERSLHLDLRDPDAYVRRVHQEGATTSLKLCLAARSLNALTARAEDKARESGRAPFIEGLRGSARECYGHVALPLDIDFQGPSHAEEDLPTEAEALALVESLPLEPGLVVRSGGGYHAYLLLDRPVDGEERLDLFARIEAYLVTAGREGGWKPDLAPLEVTGSLRVAGVIRGKHGPDRFDPTPIVSDSGARWSAEDVVAAFPDLPEHTSRAGRASRGGEYDEGVDPGEFDEDAKPGTRLAALYPVDRMLVEVFGCELRSGDRVAFPREDGSINPQDTHGQVVVDDNSFDDAKGVFINGTRWANRWGVKRDTFLTSWAVMGLVLCEGDWSLARHVAAAVVDADDHESALADLDEVLKEAWESGDPAPLIAERYPRRSRHLVAVPSNVVVGSADDSDDDVATGEIVEASAVESVTVGDGWTFSTLENIPDTKLQVRIAGSLTGLYEWRVTETDSAGNPIGGRWDLVLPWVASRVSLQVENGDDQNARATVVVIPRSGAPIVLRGLTNAESLDPVVVATRANIQGRGIKIPDPRIRKAATDMLTDFACDARSQERVIRRTGPVVAEDGTHRFLGVVASMATAGVTTDLLATKPSGTEKVKDRPTIDTIGWRTLPTTTDEILAAAGTVEALIDVVPRRRGVGIAMLGLFAAALTGATTRTTLTMDAVSGCGKSQAASCLTPLFSLAPRSTDKPPVDLEKDSAAYTFAVMRFLSYLPAWLDDARVNTENQRKAEASAGLITDAVQAAFNGSAGGRADGAGGLRAQEPVRSPALMTAERISTQAAVRNRSLIIGLDPNDVDRFAREGRTPGLDVYTDDYANTGLANDFGAVLVHHIVKNLDERGTLAPPGRFPMDGGESEAITSLAHWANRTQRAHMHRFVADREAGSAAYIRMGWDVIYDVAKANGFMHLLPTPEEVEAELIKLVEATRVSTASIAPGLRYIQAAANFVSAGRGHLVSHTLGEPADSLSRGWRVRGGGDFARPVHDAQGIRVGHVSADGRYVVLMSAGLTAAAKSEDSGLALYSGQEMDRFLRPFCATDLMPAPGSKDAKCSATLGLKTRQRGWVVPMALFEGDEDAMADLTSGGSACPACEDPGLFVGSSCLRCGWTDYDT